MSSVQGSKDQLAIIKTKKTHSFPLPGIGKPFPSKPNLQPKRNPTTKAEIKRPAKRMGERSEKKVDRGWRNGGRKEGRRTDPGWWEGLVGYDP